MSNPPNRLAEFRSYSYYHVLAMCDSTQTADALAESTDLNVWEHATSNTREEDNRPNLPNLGPYSPKRVPGAGKYIILINGSTDAAFVINTAKWTTATGANAVPGDKGTSIAIEGSINISEPKGIAFLDQIVKCSVALGVDSAQVAYVVKTFFVGHGFRSENIAQPEFSDHITDIPAITFLLTDATGSFTESGGSYIMEFVGAGHGAARMPQYSKAVNSMNVVAGDSLEKTLKRLQNNINENYAKYFDCVYQQMKSSTGDSVELLKSLRKVTYVIEVGEDYQDKTGASYVVTNQSQQYKNGAGCNDPAQVTFPAHTSIETAISSIMMMSPQVQADMATGDTSTKKKYEYKIHSAVLSEQAAGAGLDGVFDYTVYYRVERFLTPKSLAYDPAFQVLSQDNAQLLNDPQYQEIKRNIIEFDYLYTGKNIDILEFDMKVNMGLAYLQIATLVNTFKSQLEPTPNRQTQPSTQDMNNYPVKFGAIVQTPIFFGSQIKTPNLINSTNAGHTIQSAYTLTKHSSLEVTDVSMKILGNTKLLGAVNRTTSASYVRNSGNKQSRIAAIRNVADNGESESQFADWSHIPAYVKIRIKMPRENDDFSLFTGQSTTGDPRTDSGATDYARDFWFDGYYYVVGVEHIFDGGEFTQVLQLLGIPKRSAFESTSDNASREVDINSGVGSCYDNLIGMESTPSTAPTVPHTPPSGTTAPTNRPDADTANTGARSPSDVKGWDSASPAVRTAITDAASRYGVDVVVLAQFAQHESKFVATAQPYNPKTGEYLSSAAGLFQFIKGTWNGLVSQGRVVGASTANATVSTPGKKASPDDPRFDPLLNSYAGAAYIKLNTAMIGSNTVGDLYLAHFLGPDAKKVIQTDNTRGGNVSLTEVFGANWVAEKSAANPSVFTKNPTVGSLRAWAATSMSTTLKNPLAVAAQRKATPPTAAANATGQTLLSSDPQNAGRSAGAAVAAQQNVAAQSAKVDARTCGPTAQSVPQDRSNRGDR